MTTAAAVRLQSRRAERVVDATDGRTVRVSANGVDLDGLMQAGDWLHVRIRRKSDGAIKTLPVGDFTSAVTDNGDTWTVVLTHASLAGCKVTLSCARDQWGEVSHRPKLELGSDLGDFAAHSLTLRFRSPAQHGAGPEYLMDPKTDGRLLQNPREATEGLAWEDGDGLSWEDGTGAITADAGRLIREHPGLLDVNEQLGEIEDLGLASWHQWSYIWDGPSRRGMLVRCDDLAYRGKLLVFTPEGDGGCSFDIRFYAWDNVKGDTRSYAWEYAACVRPMTGDEWDAARYVAFRYKQAGHYGFRRGKLRDLTPEQRGAWIDNSRLHLWIGLRPLDWALTATEIANLAGYFTDVGADGIGSLVYHWHPNDMLELWPDAFPVSADVVAAVTGEGGITSTTSALLYAIIQSVDPTAAAYASLGLASYIMRDENGDPMLRIASALPNDHVLPLRVPAERTAVLDHWKSGLDTAFGAGAIRGHYLDALFAFGGSAEHNESEPENRGVGNSSHLHAARTMAQEWYDAFKADDDAYTVITEHPNDFMFDIAQCTSLPMTNGFSLDLTDIEVPVIPAMWSQYIQFNSFVDHQILPVFPDIEASLAWQAAEVFHWGKIPIISTPVNAGLKGPIPSAGDGEAMFDENIVCEDGEALAWEDDEIVRIEEGWWKWGEGHMGFLDTLFCKAWAWVKTYMRLGLRLRALPDGHEHQYRQVDYEGLLEFATDRILGALTIKPTAAMPRGQVSAWYAGGDTKRIAVFLTNWHASETTVVRVRMETSDYGWLRGPHTVRELDIDYGEPFVTEPDLEPLAWEDGDGIREEQDTPTEFTHRAITDRWDETFTVQPYGLRVFTIDECPDESWLEFGLPPAEEVFVGEHGYSLATESGEELATA